MEERNTFRHIFLITDIEGVAGVTDWRQTSKPGPKLDDARLLLTDEVNAVVDGLFRKAEELSLLPRFRVSVWDGHGCGGIAFEHLDPRVVKFRQFSERDLHVLFTYALNEDPPMDSLGFVGQHAMAGTGGNLCHTYSRRRVSKHVLNGVEIGEFGTRALHAWELGVRTVFISGDDVACREASEVIPGIVRAVVKVSRGVCAAESVTHADSCITLRKRAGKILELEPCSPTLTPRLLPKPPYVYQKLYRKRCGVFPRSNRTLRSEDLLKVLRSV